ncbi:TetR/AcrR family transcriptional regulator C-terminal domain-containing protein [Nonomuraea sp. NPDC059023]|uniref:TetR/AcrR family transcriptional regulator C-terminal domain-containing protein n=1 Tax=unclassified Nonomuraea TaxID=2593643 RepID=UPI0036A9A5A0
MEQLRVRIISGELSEGELVPSTRQITREWGVAMATASKVLAALREEGLVRMVPGVGTVVAWSAPGSPGRGGPAVARAGSTAAGGPGRSRELTVARVLLAAIELADEEGLAAVSMRRVATALGVPTMALHRYVRGRGELVQEMVDQVYGEARLPGRVPDGWRKQVELSLRLQWGIHRRHPWLASAYPLTRPYLGANGLAHTEWIMRAVSGLGLDPNTMLHVTVSLAAFIRGLAANLEPEARAVQDTGMSDDEWMATREAALRRLMPAHPTLAAVLRDQHLDLDLDTLFEFGLKRQLDALEALARAD